MKFDRPTIWFNNHRCNTLIWALGGTLFIQFITGLYAGMSWRPLLFDSSAYFHQLFFGGFPGQDIRFLRWLDTLPQVPAALWITLTEGMGDFTAEILSFTSTLYTLHTFFGLAICLRVLRAESPEMKVLVALGMVLPLGMVGPFVVGSPAFSVTLFWITLSLLLGRGKVIGLVSAFVGLAFGYEGILPLVGGLVWVAYLLRNRIGFWCGMGVCIFLLTRLYFAYGHTGSAFAAVESTWDPLRVFAFGVSISLLLLRLAITRYEGFREIRWLTGLTALFWMVVLAWLWTKAPWEIFHLGRAFSARVFVVPLTGVFALLLVISHRIHVRCPDWEKGLVGVLVVVALVSGFQDVARTDRWNRTVSELKGQLALAPCAVVKNSGRNEFFARGISDHSLGALSLLLQGSRSPSGVLLGASSVESLWPKVCEEMKSREKWEKITGRYFSFPEGMGVSSKKKVTQVTAVEERSFPE